MEIDVLFFFFFKQKTAYEIGTGDWSSDVCSSDLFPNPNISESEEQNDTRRERTSKIYPTFTDAATLRQ